MPIKTRIKNLPGVVYFLGAVVLMCSPRANALPFPLFDARTAAMGGVAIGHEIRNAAFYNPALASLEPEGYDAYLLVPGSGEFVSDPDGVKGEIADIVAGGGDVASINNKVYQKYEYSVAQLTIPTPFLGGAAYIADYSFHTAKVINNADLVHRAVSVFETGVTVSQLQDVMWAENVLMGATVKLLLLESYGYQEAVGSGDFKLDSDEEKTGSILDFDFGMSKEYGVWKTAFVVKNLMARSRKFGNSNDSFTLEPQARAGVAYQSRRAVIEVDLDLTKNEGVGFGSETMFASVGWEWKVFRALEIRLGFQQNLAGDKNATFSSGLGFRLWSLLLDLSASVSPDGHGSFFQASWEF